MPRQRPDATKEAHRATAAEKTLRGWTQQRIADELGISVMQVNIDLRTARAEWKKQREQSIDKWAAEILAKYLELYRINMEAYERSIGETRKETRRVKRGKDKEEIPGAEVTVTTEELNGDPRYLAGAADALRQIRALLGLDAPEKSEVKAEHTIRVIEEEKPGA